MDQLVPTFPDYNLPTLDLAKSLLGSILVHDTAEGRTAGIIAEVEAYIGPDDKGAHSYGGRPTPRTQVMYGAPGHAYVYQIYGLHYCFNVVSGPIGAPEAILVRALQPTEGVTLMATRRHLQQLQVPGSVTTAAMKQLTNGPGKLAQALGITKLQYGLKLTDSPLRIYQGTNVPEAEIAAGPRIGIDYAEEARDYPWRFWIRGNPFVSR